MEWMRWVGWVALGCMGWAAAGAQEPAAVTVLAPHWVALRFAPEFPYGRHTQNPLVGEGVSLPMAESVMGRSVGGGKVGGGQVGAGEGNTVKVVEYRVPVPDFVVMARVEHAILLSDVEMSAGVAGPRLDGMNSSALTAEIGMVKAGLGIDPRAFAKLKSFSTVDALKDVVNPAEFTVEFDVSKGGTVKLHGAGGGAKVEPVLLLQTHFPMMRLVGWKSEEQSGVKMPAMAPLFDQFLRDTSIVLGPDGMYYMTGTTGGPEAMVVTSDLSVWKSADLVNWRPVKDGSRPSTVVWNIDRDGTWMKPITLRDGEPFRPLWAPEIHYMKGTFWIPFSVPRHGVTLLKSTSGKAEGPYEIAIKPDEPVADGIDASLFQDEDGTVYFLYGGGWIAKMKPDMSGLAEPFRRIRSASGRDVGFEGVYLFKDKGVYTLCAADFVLGEYNTYIATAKSLDGPWSERYLAVPHAGHGNFFKDKNGRMWSTFFGNDRHAPFSAKPAVVPMELDSEGRWRPDADAAMPAGAASGKLVQGVGAIGPSDGKPQQVGVMPVRK